MLEEFLVSSEVHETQKGGLTRPPKISEVRGSSLKDSHLGWFYKMEKYMYTQKLFLAPTILLLSGLVTP